MGRAGALGGNRLFLGQFLGRERRAGSHGNSGRAGARLPLLQHCAMHLWCSGCFCAKEVGALNRFSVLGGFGEQHEPYGCAHRVSITCIFAFRLLD